jgi:hypothetical protein
MVCHTLNQGHSLLTGTYDENDMAISYVHCDVTNFNFMYFIYKVSGA